MKTHMNTMEKWASENDNLMQHQKTDVKQLKDKMNEMKANIQDMQCHRIITGIQERTKIELRSGRIHQEWQTNRRVLRKRRFR